MASLNIDTKNPDSFFRYKMPKLIAKVEGKGNGIKTVIVNMADIAKALNRPPMYPTKYFGCVLGAQVNYDNKGERFIVNGAHESDRLQDLLDGFIAKYVLCTSCRNPETILSVNKKKEVIGTNCMACGHSATISASNDRVGAYILKNPPPKPTPVTAPTAAAGASGSPTDANDGKDKSKTSGKSSKSKSSKSRSHDHSSSNNTNNSNDNSMHQLHNDDLKKLNEDDDDWGEDTGADAVRKRLEELSAGAKCLMLNDDLEKKASERLQIYYDFVKEKLESSDFDLTFAENQKLIKSEAERLDVNDKAVTVLCEILLDEQLIEKTKLYKNLFLRFTHDNPKAQKYLLRALELTICSKKDVFLSKVLAILHLYYDLEIIDEDVFVEWYAKGAKKRSIDRDILEKATPFVKWLNEAAEETDDEEDDNEVDVDFNDRIVGGLLVEEDNKVSPKASQKVASKSKNESVAKDDEEDDLDIDAI